MTPRRLTTILVALLAFSRPSGATTACGHLLAAPPGPLQESLISAYEKILDSGAGTLTERDLLRLRHGDPLALGAGDSVEAMAIAEGLEALGRHARQSLDDDKPFLESLRRILDRRLDEKRLAGADQGITIARQGNIPALSIVLEGSVPFHERNHVVLSKDGNRAIVLVERKSGTRIWDTRRNRTGILPFHVWSAEFNADGSRLLTLNLNGLPQLWNTERADYPEPIPLPKVKAFTPVSKIEFVNGDRVAILASKLRDDVWAGFSSIFSVNHLRAIDLTTGAILNSVEPRDSMSFLGASPDGRRVVTVTNAVRDNRASLWDAGLWQRRSPWSRFWLPTNPVGTLSGNHVQAAAWSPDGATLAVASFRNGPRNTVHLLDGHTFRERAKWDAETHVSSLAFSPDGKSLMAVDSIGVIVWDVSTGREVATLALTRPSAAAGFAGNDHLWIADQTLALWHIRSSREELPLSHGSRLGAVAQSADGSLLFEASHEGEPRIWDLKQILE